MDYSCPRCSENESTPGVKLIFSICGHHLCERCMKNLFRNDTVISCPTCEKELKRTDYSNKYVEDREIEKDREMRKYVTSVFNKIEENFTSKIEYYDYLEMVETMIENLLKQKDSEKIRKEIEKEKEARGIDIEKTEVRKKDILNECYEKAIIEDALYNENLKEEANRIHTHKKDDMEVDIVMKVMPNCLNLDSVKDMQNYDIKSMAESLKVLFLAASGYDIDEMKNTSLNELIEGMR